MQDLRQALRAYSEIKESDKSTNFRSATFKAKGKGLIAIEKDGNHATFALSEHSAQKILQQTDYSANGIRKGGYLIGLRVNLAELTVQQVQT